MAGSGGTAGQQDTSDPQEAEAEAEVDAVVQQVVSGGGPSAQPLNTLPPDTAGQLFAQDYRQDIGLKKTYAYILLGLLGGQVIAADGVFVTYAQVGADWNLSAPVIDVWLGATLVEVVGIVYVVTRYLFPRRDVQP
jgi:hypothetical protein